MSTLQQRRTGNAPTSSTLGHDDSGGTKRRKGRTKSQYKNNGIPLSIAFGLCCMVAIWLFIPFYMVKFGYWSRIKMDNGFIRSGSSIHPPNATVPPTTVKATTTSNGIELPNYRKQESEVIDMRSMSATLPFDDKDGGVWKQGWDLEPKKLSKAPGPLKIFVIPHSHCDPGWIKTFDDYFRSQTSQIITSIVNALALDKRRKFIWAEISYFEWWWREQTPEMRALAKQLLKRGQLEFVTGGWVQPDEANTELYAMTIQLQEGHDWIRETLGEEFIPKYGWSIDPFGYSPTMAYLLNKFGFKGMLIQRVHYAVKKELASKKQLEFMWRQTWDQTGDHDIFTHLMPFYSYDVPHTCGPDPSVCCQFDFARRMTTYGHCPWGKQPIPITAVNVHERAMLLLDQYLKKATLYRGNALLIPLGDDFRYQTSEEAELQYRNYQTIFDYINKNVPNVGIQFGTLSEYFNEVVGTFDTPVLKGSFFTYADRAQDYWSGYFTSRVFDKALDRQLERILYAAESLGATAEQLRGPRRALSLFQHHDGVTGTAKSHVVDDYASKMHTAIQTVQKWVRAKIVPDSGSGIEACWRSDSPRGLSRNVCTEGKEVTIYNPLDSPQMCGIVTVPPRTAIQVKYPCDVRDRRVSSSRLARFKFDKEGMLIEPIQEQWMKWKVNAGGAYLFSPGILEKYPLGSVEQKEGGWVVSTPNWKRTLLLHEYSGEFDQSAIVLDFIYETNLQSNNEEWFVRFSSNIRNEGVFHTDLNGFNFDTHRFRGDMPIQSQVFPMPTMASIEDRRMRMSVISEHAQGTASLETGAIDVWLDRRLQQDDNRGLAQGVMDNVPTRTRLRVVLEMNVSITQEFEVTALGRRMWDELNHPLEAFGEHEDNRTIDDHAKDKSVSNIKAVQSKEEHLDGLTPIIPFVIMVFKRLDYLKECIDSIRKSDVNKERVPIVISQDGNVPEMTEYIESLKNEFRIHRLVHPYSCYEHPDGFPGDVAGLLNSGYKGDTYKHPREGFITCCKHHFTWIMKTVHSNLTLDGLPNVDHFFFLEEDYVVAPNVYETIVTGLGMFDKVQLPPSENSVNNSLFGLLLDPTNGHSKMAPDFKKDGFFLTEFVTGPMVLSKSSLDRIIQNANKYCEFDDYNWDWSIVHLMSDIDDFPRICLVPTRPQVKHIGAEGGMHKVDPAKLQRLQAMSLKPKFHPQELFPIESLRPREKNRKGFGGWGHPADHEHCLKVLEGS